MVLWRANGAQPLRLRCAPVSYRWDAICIVHDALGHAAVQQTRAHLPQQMHWRGLLCDVKVTDVRLFVVECDACRCQPVALVPCRR
jgi:hypothetical protein